MPRRALMTPAAVLLLLAAAAAAATAEDPNRDKLTGFFGTTPSPEQWAIFKNLRTAVLGAAPAAANSAMEGLVKAKQCAMVRHVVHAVGHCPFTDPEDPAELRRAREWMDACRVDPTSFSYVENEDSWYYSNFRADWEKKNPSAGGNEGFNTAMDALGTLVAEVTEVAAFANEERARLEDGKGIEKVLKSTGIDNEELKNVVNGVEERAKAAEARGAKPEAEVGALTLLVYLAKNEDPYLMRREELWRAINADAYGRCTYSRATLRWQETAYEVLAVLSSRAFCDPTDTSCVAMAKGHDKWAQGEADAAAAAGDGAEGVDGVDGPPQFAPAPESIDGVATCEAAATGVMDAVMAISATRAGVALLNEYNVHTIRDRSLTGTPDDTSLMHLVLMLSSHDSLSFSLGISTLACPMLIVGVEAEGTLDRIAPNRASEVALLVSESMLVAKDLQPVQTATKLLTSTLLKMSTLDSASFAQADLYHVNLQREMARAASGDVTKLQLLATRTRAAFYRALMAEPLVEANTELVIRLRSAAEKGRAVLNVVGRSVPGLGRVLEFVRRLSPASLARLGAFSTMLSLWQIPKNAIDMLKHSLVLQEILVDFRFPQAASAAYARATERAVAAWRGATGSLPVFRYGRVAAASRVASRTASRALAVTARGGRAVASGTKLVARVAIKSAGRLIAPVSVALDVYDSYDMVQKGHYASAAVKGAAAVLGVVAMASMMLLPGVGLLALGLSVILSGAADYMMHTAEREARYDLARSLGFTPGASRNAERLFVTRSSCAEIAGSRVPELQATVAGLMDGYTWREYELALVRLYKCLHTEGRCDKARAVGLHRSGKLAGAEVADEVDGRQHGMIEEAMALCGVDPGVTEDPETALRYLQARTCKDVCDRSGGGDVPLETALKSVSVYKIKGQREVLRVFQCLGGCESKDRMRQVIVKVGALKLLSGFHFERRHKMEKMMFASGSLAFNAPSTAIKRINGIYMNGGPEALAAAIHAAPPEEVSLLFSSCALSVGMRNDALATQLSRVAEVLAKGTEGNEKLLRLRYSPIFIYPHVSLSSVRHFLMQAGGKFAEKYMPKYSIYRCYHDRELGILVAPAEGTCQYKVDLVAKISSLGTCNLHEECTAARDDPCVGSCRCRTAGLNSCDCVKALRPEDLCEFVQEL